MTVIDKNGILLLDGAYHLKLYDSTNGFTQDAQRNRNLSWEELPLIYADAPNHSHMEPVLKFRLLSCDQNINICRQDINGNVNCRSEMEFQMDHLKKKQSSNAHVILIDCASKVNYQFIYNDTMSQKTKAIEPFICPWCKLNCRYLKALMKHLTLCHSRFEFELTYTPEACVINVRINRNFSLNEKLPKKGQTHYEYYRRHRSDLDAVTQQCHNDSVNIRRRIYKSSTNAPVQHVQEYAEDSEGEHDTEWLRQYTKRMIHEFTDVNEGEKSLMTLWNYHLMKSNIVGDKHIPLACEIFIEKYGQDLWNQKLYRNFLLHLCNLFDAGLLTRKNVQNLTIKMQKIR